MRLKKVDITSIIIVLLFAFTIGYLLYWRVTVGMTRFFDVDEFTHIHWAANMAKGQRMYIDFFTFFTPVFYWFLQPLFWIFHNNPSVFLAGRVVALGLLVSNAFLISILFARLRSVTWFLLPMMIFLWLPMPYDKITELRPDNLALVFALLGVWLQIEGLWGRKFLGFHLYFWSGIMYALMMLTLVKMVPFLVIGGLVWLTDKEVWKEIRLIIKGKLKIPSLWNTSLGFPMSLIVVGVLFLLWGLSLGNFSVVWYSLTKLALESNRWTKFTVMEPHLFFFPNGSFYGGVTAITKALIANHAVWVIGGIMGTIRLFSPYVTADGDGRKARAELLLAGIWFTLVAIYVVFYPLKHSQYLIPIAVFVAFYFADACTSLFIGFRRMFGKNGERIGSVIVLCGIVWTLVVTTPEVNMVKLTWTNQAQIEQTQIMLATIPKNSEVFDMEGRMIYWPDAYYVCCLPFGGYIDYLSRRPEPLSLVLERKKVPYLFQGRTGRFSQLSWDEQQYIRSHYTPVEGWGEELWKRTN